MVCHIFAVNLATNNTVFFYFMFKMTSFFFLILCSKQFCFWLVNTKILMDVDRRDTLTLLQYSRCKSRDQFRSDPKLTRIPECFILLLTLSSWLSSAMAGLLYELYMISLIKKEKLKNSVMVKFEELCSMHEFDLLIYLHQIYTYKMLKFLS